MACPTRRRPPDRQDRPSSEGNEQASGARAWRMKTPRVVVRKLSILCGSEQRRATVRRRAPTSVFLLVIEKVASFLALANDPLAERSASSRAISRRRHCAAQELAQIWAGKFGRNREL
jgi:hypothetical protein